MIDKADITLMEETLLSGINLGRDSAKKAFVEKMQRLDDLLEQI